jgi:hypothetical protein
MAERIGSNTQKGSDCMTPITRKQREALRRIWARGADDRTYRQLRRDVVLGHDCLMLKWAGMWLGIERDGYTHS